MSAPIVFRRHPAERGVASGTSSVSGCCCCCCCCVHTIGAVIGAVSGARARLVGAAEAPAGKLLPGDPGETSPRPLAVVRLYWVLTFILTEIAAFWMALADTRHFTSVSDWLLRVAGVTAAGSLGLALMALPLAMLLAGAITASIVALAPLPGRQEGLRRVGRMTVRMIVGSVVGLLLMWIPAVLAR
jgi:hypothetical protein